MADSDERLEPQTDVAPEQEQPFDKEAWGKQKQAQRETVYSMAEQATVSLGEMGNFRQYLSVQKNFPQYSVNNALLIAAQMPEATQLRSFDAWKAQGVSVQKGAKGIQILEPGKEYTGTDGQPRKSMNVKIVFDISQTDAKPVPAPAYDDEKLLKALTGKYSKPCVMSDQLPNGKVAHFDGEQILVRKDCDAMNLFRAIAVEMAVSEGANAFQAKSAATILCQKYGFPLPMLGPLPDVMSSGDAQAIRDELGKIRDVAKDIGNRMFRNLEPKREVR